MKNTLSLATLLAVIAVTNSANAQSVDAPAVEEFTLDQKPSQIQALSHSASEDWRFSFMAYLWLPGFCGDIGAGDTSTSVDSYPLNIWDNLSFAFLGEAELSKGPFTLLANGMFLGFEADDLGPNDRGTANLDGYIIDVVAGWRIAQWPLGNDSRIWLQPIVGFRYYDIELSLDVDDVGDIDVGTDLWDPVVGARLVAELGKCWVLKARADVGGFGVGTELSWLADVSATYWFNRNFFVTLGYKALGLDMDDNSGADRLVLEGILHGPYLGIGFAL